MWAVLLGALFSAALFLVVSPAVASLTPPASGDWTIGPLEDAELEGGAWVVQGNITVQGSLFVGNATLQLAPPTPGGVATVFVAQGARLRMEGATLWAGPLNRFVVTLEPSARLDLVSSTVDGMGALSTAQLSGVGLLLRGAYGAVDGLMLTNCTGGLGAQEGATLTGSGVSVEVDRRALYAASGATVSLAGFVATGNLSQTDYLVIVESSTLSIDGGNLSAAPVAVLALSAAASFRNVDLGPVADVGVMALSSMITWRGGTLTPHSRAAFESYGAVLDIQANIFNATIGAVLIESSLVLSNSTFSSSGTDPTASFAAVFARDSTAVVSDSTFSGEYWIRNDVRLINGTPTVVPLYGCSTSAVWSVRSHVDVRRTSTSCFSIHFQMEDSDFHPASLNMSNGTEGIRMLRGTIQAVDLEGSLFVGPQDAVVTVFEADGSIDGIVSRGNSYGVEVSGSDVRVDRLTYESPGTGVRVVSGSPTINGSSFRAHNATAVEVQSGFPLISNSSFILSATTLNATGVFIVGGFPTVETSSFTGQAPRSQVLGVWAQPGSSPTIRTSRFVELERAAVVYSRGFLLEGNSVEACNQGFESREFSSGTIAGNTFSNMTSVGVGNAVRIYIASTLVTGNTFEHVNYGVQVIFQIPSAPGISRISGNTFVDVSWFAIQILNSTRPVVIDNNTVRGAVRGSVELFRAPAVASYNLFIDGEGVGYSVIEANLSIWGDRLENLSRGVEIIDGILEVRYSTFSRNAFGVFAQDSPTTIHNSSFQSNAIAVEFPNGGQNEVFDSLFLANVDGILAFNSANVDIRNTNFLRTLGFIVSCEQNSSANIHFSRRGEISGGTLKLQGNLTSDAPLLRLSSIRFQLQPLSSGVPGVFIRGAAELSLEALDFANPGVRYQFVISGSSGSLLDTSLVAPFPDPAGPQRSPSVEGSQLFVRNLRIESPQAAPSFVGSTIVANNFSVRNSNASSLYLEGGSFALTDAALLDGDDCGVSASGGAVINATNVTIRGHPNGSVCGADIQGSFYVSDLASGPVDVVLTGGSHVGLWSTRVANSWTLAGPSMVTRGWRVSVAVSLANPSLLTTIAVAVSDALGHREVSRPNSTGAVPGLPYFPQLEARVGATSYFGPYVVSATLGPLSNSATIDLNRDWLVQLSLDDTIAPTVSIEDPASGEVFADSNVTIGFSAQDEGTGIRELTYRFGAGTPNTVELGNGSYAFLRSLVDGTHLLTVRAVDFSGNAAEANLSFTIDTLAPLISINSPRIQPHETSDLSVQVQVGFDPDVVRVTIGGEEAVIYHNTANRTLTVPEGSTTVEVVAFDRAGNVGGANVTIIADRTPPALEVANRQDNNVTIESFLVVRGSSEPGALVFVQGVPVTTVNGSFEALVRLAVGQNTIDIRARDALGNENSTALVVTRGVLEPSTILDLVVSLLGVALLAAGVLLLARSTRSEYKRAQQEGRIRRRPKGGYR